MKIQIVCVGKIKEEFYRNAVAEYVKRLSRYCACEVIEVADERTPDGAGAAEEEQIKRREAGRILAKLKDGTRVYTLEIQGKRYTSEGFARLLEQDGVNGRSQLAFVIGGSLGLHASVLARSDGRISFSDMTFPHQLMRVILAEQIYRAFRIINGEPYHK